MPAVMELPAGRSGSAWPAIHELRPHISSAEAFATRVDEVQRAQGYRLVGSFEQDDADAAAAAGFRVADSLAWGRYLYVDDLVTRQALRRRGHAAGLMEWLMAEASRLECDQLHLDSGTGSERWDAHALYFAQGLRIVSHHFAAHARRR